MADLPEPPPSIFALSTRATRGFEEELGVSLFERVAKDRMAPTPAGQRLYDFVRPFFESLPIWTHSLW